MGIYGFLFVQSSPLTYYLYAFFPVWFWEEVFVRRRALVEGKNKLFAKFSQQDIMKMAFNVAAYLVILEVMVQSYYHREIYTICYVLAAAWPAFYGMDFLRDNTLLCGTWALGCTAMSIFTLLPALKVEDPNLIQLGGLLILILGVFYIAFEKSLLVSTAPHQADAVAKKPNGISRMILGVQVRDTATLEWQYRLADVISGRSDCTFYACDTIERRFFAS
jgi:phosphatidylinositol glycan class N